MNRVDRLIELAQEIVVEDPDFFQTTGPGEGNRRTNAFMRELQSRAEEAFNQDLSEKRICGSTRLAVDFYFQEESTIVEVALSLRNSNTEFEKNILKALMAQKTGQAVNKLLFLSKPAAKRKHSQPSSRDVIKWVRRNHDIQVEIKELTPGQTYAI